MREAASAPTVPAASGLRGKTLRISNPNPYLHGAFAATGPLPAAARRGAPEVQQTGRVHRVRQACHRQFLCEYRRVLL